jgi:benzoyl-CoA reductase subunit B
MKETKVDVVKEFLKTLETVKEHVKQKYPERTFLYEPALKYFELVHEGMAQGKPMLWFFFCLTTELFRALDITVFSPEFFASIMSGLRSMQLKYLDIANQKLPDHICSVNKFPIGLALSGDTVTPDMLVYSAANPCDSGLISYSSLQHYLNIPSFCLDTPYLSDERAHKSRAKQIRNMVSFIEEQTGQKLDPDRLREVIGYANQAQDYILKLNELRKNVPSPTCGQSVIITGGAMMGLSGVPFFTDWCRKQYEAAKEKAEKGEGAIPEEKIRLLWIATVPDDSIFNWLEKEYGAVTVASLLSSFPPEPIDNAGDISKIFEGLGQRFMDVPMSRHGRPSVDYFIKECISVARDYKVDAIINAGNTGCKYNWASAQLIKDAVNDELGIPTLLFECDPWDPSFVPLESAKAKFDQFFDLVL